MDMSTEELGSKTKYEAWNIWQNITDLKMKSFAKPQTSWEVFL